MVHASVDGDLQLIAGRTAVADVRIDLRGTGGYARSVTSGQGSSAVCRDSKVRVRIVVDRVLILGHQATGSSESRIVEVGAANRFPTQAAHIDSLDHGVVSELVLEAEVEVLSIGRPEVWRHNIGEWNRGSEELT